MYGLVKYNWNDNSPIGNTSPTDKIIASIRNITQSTDYQEDIIGIRSDEQGNYIDIAFNFQDILFTFYKTQNQNEGTQSEPSIQNFVVRELDNVSISLLEASPQQIKIDWLIVGTNHQLSDTIFLKVENTTTSNLRKRWAFGGLASRDALATILNSLDSLGDEGDTLEVSIGWMSAIGEYSPEITQQISIQAKSLWIQGDGFEWIQGDGNKWFFEP
jgi:hypothetical protein